LSTFVSVGNLKRPFTRLLQAMRDNLALLPGPVVVQHGHSTFEDPACVCVPFLKMEDFQRQVASAAIVILHGGAGSIITALRAGKKPIVMARRAHLGEHVDDHQQELLQELGSTGQIFVIEDSATMRDALGSALASGPGRAPSGGRIPSRMHELVRADLETWAKAMKQRH
jgi:UDP-N-acetylglucosamine transferase subunit ALG13